MDKFSSRFLSSNGLTRDEDLQIFFKFKIKNYYFKNKIFPAIVILIYSALMKASSWKIFLKDASQTWIHSFINTAFFTVV